MTLSTRKRLLRQFFYRRRVLMSVMFLVALYVRFLYLTNRVQYRIDSASQPYLGNERQGIICFWHGRLLMQGFVKPKRELYALFSAHQDGAIISGFMEWFGVRAIKVSKNKGATDAMRKLLDVAAQGASLSITPDGPRGPNQVAAPGTAYAAAKSGLPVIPVTYACTRYHRLETWDRFMIPKPFGRILFIVAAPIFVGAKQLRQGNETLQNTLNRITQEADRACGVSA